jgi:hypothetical protein
MLGNAQYKGKDTTCRMSPFPERLAALEASHPVLSLRIHSVFDVFRQCFERWRPSELSLSFNGGKDCTVLLHLLFAFARTHPGACADVSAVRIVFFDTETGFPEVEEFMRAMQSLYGFTLECLPGLKTGMASLVSQGVQAVVLGTRRTDPHGGTRPQRHPAFDDRHVASSRSLFGPVLSVYADCSCFWWGFSPFLVVTSVVTGPSPA